MISIEDLRLWLDSLDREKYVAVDEGGLTLVALDELPPAESDEDPPVRLSGATMEVGGVPEDAETNTL